jgi:hypothetical protein
MMMRRLPCGSSSMKVMCLISSFAMSPLVHGISRTRERFGRVTLDKTARYVSSFFFIYSGCLGLISLIGRLAIGSGDLAVVKFTTNRVKERIRGLTDIDDTTLSFAPYVIHAKCVGYEKFHPMVVEEGDTTKFRDNVYFHPNIRTDGWLLLKEIYRGCGIAWRIDRDAYEARILAEARYGKKVDDDAVYRKFGSHFREFPSEPHFWDHRITGSRVFIWPPRLFLSWAEKLRRGEVFSLHQGPPPLFPPPANNSPLLPHTPSASNPSTPSTSHPPTPGPSNTRRSATPLAGPSKLNDTSDENFGNFAFTEEELANLDLDDY